MNQITIGNYVRISKSKARKLFENYEKFTVVPCKVNPINSWGLGMEVEYFDWSVGCSFDEFMNNYQYYNCNSELGRYPSFYVKSE